jgi:two-component system, NarL family, response regulator LiaR
MATSASIASLGNTALGRSRQESCLARSMPEGDGSRRPLYSKGVSAPLRPGRGAAVSVSGERPIRVLLVDDHAVVRKGLQALLDREPGVEVAGEAEDGEQAVHAADRLRPDVILMDLEMPGIGGIEASRRITEAHPDTKIVVLTSHASEEDVFPALKAGALGYLLKHSAPEDVLQAIRQAQRGETVLHPAIARMVLQELHRPPHPKQTATTDPLSERELDVLRLLARGMSNQEIADSLVVGEATVRSHVSSILRKLQLASRTQAALYALREGLASLDQTDPSR